MVKINHSLYHDRLCSRDYCFLHLAFPVYLLKLEASPSDKKWDWYQEPQALSATSLEICLFSLSSESLDKNVPYALYGISSLFKFFKQVFKAKFKIHRPSSVLTSNVDILRLNGVSFLPKYLNIRLTVIKILGERVTRSAMNLEYPVCWPLLTQQENPVSQKENS